MRCVSHAKIFFVYLVQWDFVQWIVAALLKSVLYARCYMRFLETFLNMVVIEFGHVLFWATLQWDWRIIKLHTCMDFMLWESIGIGRTGLIGIVFNLPSLSEGEFFFSWHHHTVWYQISKDLTQCGSTRTSQQPRAKCGPRIYGI